MNVTSNNSIVKEEYSKNGKNGNEIKTYIFQNGRFYKVAYIQNYLVSISGFENEASLYFADLALENVEIGEDNKALVEAANNFFKIAKAMGPAEEDCELSLEKDKLRIDCRYSN